MKDKADFAWFKTSICLCMLACLSIIANSQISGQDEPRSDQNSNRM